MNISFTIPNLDPSNNTKMDSDPFVNFKIDHDTGNLTKIQEFPAGGMVPRHFSYSNDGSLVAVVLSRDQRVMIIDRDVQSGLLTRFRAWVHVDKEPSFVLWKQEKLSVSHLPTWALGIFFYSVSQGRPHCLAPGGPITLL